MLEYGNKKSAEEKINDALESLNEISKLEACSAVEDLVNERERTEMHNTKSSKFLTVTSTEEGDSSSTAGPLIKNNKIVTNVRMIWKHDIDLRSAKDQKG